MAFSSYAAWKLPAAAALAGPAQEWSDLASTTSEASCNLGRLTPVEASYGGPVILIERRRTVPPSAVGLHVQYVFTVFGTEGGYTPYFTYLRIALYLEFGAPACASRTWDGRDSRGGEGAPDIRVQPRNGQHL